MKIKMIILAGVCAVLVGATAVRGEVPVDKRWYITPGVDYIFADSDRSSDDDPGFRLGIGKAISRTWNIELNALVDNLAMKGTNDDFEQKGISLNALYFFTRDWRISPYGVFGIGALETRVPGEKSTNLMAELGLGLNLSSNGGMALRLEARHRYDGDDSSISSEDHFNDWLAGLALAIPLGKKAREEMVQVETMPAPVPAPVPVPVPVPVPAPKDDDGDGVMNDMDLCPGTPSGVKVDSSGCPADSDNDGVINSQDKCPDTPAGVKVDSSGCPTDSDKDGVADNMDKCPGTPAGVKVDAEGCPSDSDNDGVINPQDKCPNTPAGVKVDVKGCPPDSDGDGVADYLDKCPDTKPGFLVDDRGCPLPEKVTITLKIEFDTAKTDIRPAYHDEIKGLADFMIKYPTTTVEVGGHTDNVGKEAANVGLSQRRADAVKNYLVEKFGIDASRVTAKGYGPSKPVADNSTASGRQQNRRVEAVIETIVNKQK